MEIVIFIQDKVFKNIKENNTITPDQIDYITSSILYGRVLKEEKWLTGGKCSGCGGNAPYWSLSTTYHKSAYCPSCGAKMEEDIEE